MRKDNQAHLTQPVLEQCYSCTGHRREWCFQNPRVRLDGTNCIHVYVSIVRSTEQEFEPSAYHSILPPAISEIYHDVVRSVVPKGGVDRARFSLSPAQVDEETGRVVRCSQHPSFLGRVAEDPAKSMGVSRFDFLVFPGSFGRNGIAVREGTFVVKNIHLHPRFTTTITADGAKQVVGGECLLMA